MKIITTTLVVALTLCLSAAGADTKKAAKARSLYQQGVIAKNEGKYGLAKMSFREVLKIYPTHPQARRQLLHLTRNSASLEIGKRKKALHKVVIPKVDFNDLTVQESVEILSTHVANLAKGKVNSNFIVQDPYSNFKGKKINLTLKRVPADTLLRYILDQAGGVSSFDAHAVVIKPRQKSKAQKKQKPSSF